jgi:DNA ligase-1
MKPMLAKAVDWSKVSFPLYGSVKLDGVRCVIKDGLALSRKLIPIPNLHVQTILGHAALNGLDGEITVGPANDPNVMQTTMSAVMSVEGTPDFTFWVFDFWTAPDMPWSERCQLMQRAEKDGTFADQSFVMLLKQTLLMNDAEYRAFKQTALAQGYEGIMLRRPNGLYKYGRSTEREGHLLKDKDFVDGEAQVIGFNELMHNANELGTDNTGHAKRSTNSEGLLPMNTLGSLRVRDVKSGVEFNVGTGFVQAERLHIWTNQALYLNKFIVYKHFEQAGVKEAPRFPVYKGFRDVRDMS